MNNLVTKMIPQSLIFTVLLGALLFLGCATTQSSQPSKVVPISEFSSVAGKWAGTFWLDPRDYEDWVELQINPDGSYEYSSVNEWGAMLGSDRFSLRDGKLISVEGGGEAIYTLHQRNGKRMLKVKIVTNKGQRLTAELTPAKKK